MKKLSFLLVALIVAAAAMAQPTPQEREMVNTDLAKERNRRLDVAGDLLRGDVAEAKADHRAAVSYHKKAQRDIRQVHRNHVQRARIHPRPHPHHIRRRHVVHHRPARRPARVVVSVRH